MKDYTMMVPILTGRMTYFSSLGVKGLISVFRSSIALILGQPVYMRKSLARGPESPSSSSHTLGALTIHTLYTIRTFFYIQKRAFIWQITTCLGEEGDPGSRANFFSYKQSLNWRFAAVLFLNNPWGHATNWPRWRVSAGRKIFLCPRNYMKIKRLNAPEIGSTHSLPRVINFKFLLLRHQKYNITQYEENLAFHSLLGWKMIILPIHTTSLTHVSLKAWENVLFNLGVKGFKKWLILYQLDPAWTRIWQQNSHLYAFRGLGEISGPEEKTQWWRKRPSNLALL